MRARTHEQSAKQVLIGLQGLQSLLYGNSMDITCGIARSVLLMSGTVC